MIYYIVIGFVLVIAYQLTPAAMKRPFKLLYDIPAIWFVLFSIARGIVLTLTYPFWIIVIAAVFITKWVDKMSYKLKKLIPGKYDKIIKAILECKGIFVDGSERYGRVVNHSLTISLNNGLLVYVFHYY